MTSQPLWLRCEKKPLEHRAALTPTTAKKLIDAGFTITVERDPQRIFKDEEYEKIGCTLVENNTWAKDCPVTTPVIGLKELPVSKEPIAHTQIQFAHCYKGQEGWAGVLDRFDQGKGMLYDLEFLTDEKGRRVAAFGFHAGFAGAAAGALALAAQRDGSYLKNLDPYENETAMIEGVKAKLAEAKDAKPIKALVIGALGRCGCGAVDFFRKIGLAEENIIKWDMAETAKGGPFQEILDVDIFVNCIYLTEKIPYFLTHAFVNAAGSSRRLGVIVDVSCDTTNPNNPIQVYGSLTTFKKPIIKAVIDDGNPPLHVIAIDHLPTLLPREASEQFSTDLLPSLLLLPQRKTARVWTEAETLFMKKKIEARKWLAENEVYD